jgi:hypothetical protein
MIRGNAPYWACRRFDVELICRHSLQIHGIGLALRRMS